MRVAIVPDARGPGLCDYDTIGRQEPWDALHPATQPGRGVLLDSLTRMARGIRGDGFQLGFSGGSWKLS